MTIKGGLASSVTRVIDKVVQHNTSGYVVIDGFYIQDFGKLYRACGNCKTKITRKVTVSIFYAVNPKTGIVTMNKNNGNEAKLTSILVVLSVYADQGCLEMKRE